MPDIVIRGMEMPTKTRIDLTIFANGFVARYDAYGRYLVGAEAAQLQEGDGRLIDADKLIPDMGNYITGGSGTVGSMCTMRGYSQRKIDNAPTILEAEVKEDG